MKKIIVVIFMCAVFVSDTFAQTKSVTVYTAGSYVVDDDRKPCYWQGTTRIDLPIPEGTTGSAANSIAISGGTVYTAGYYSYSATDRYNAAYRDFNVRKACYWQGTTRIDLPVSEETKGSEANSIAISGGTVYVVGEYDDKACYWQGTTRIDLPVPEGTKGSVAFSIAISGGTVYTAGYYSYTEGYEGYYDGKACYWQGTTRIDLPVPVGMERSVANSIAISGGTVYTAGQYDGGKACYWQGTTIIDLPTPSKYFTNATSITVVNGIVYVAGDYTVREWDFLVASPCYWEGTTRNDLEMDWKHFSKNFSSSSIAVVNGIVYVAGHFDWPNNEYYSLAYYWQGTNNNHGTRIDLPIPANGSRAETSSIAIVE